MEIKEQLEEMLTMQKALNESILKEFGENAMTEEKLQLAIIDEVGELTHELKGDWCWWKKTQKTVNRQRVLEELVDVYHFVMTWELKNHRNAIMTIKYYENLFELFGDIVYEDDSLYEFISSLIYFEDKLKQLLFITEKLKFSFDEVYQEYLNKNKINYERLKNGY